MDEVPPTPACFLQDKSEKNKRDENNIELIVFIFISIYCGSNLSVKQAAVVDIRQ